MKFFFLRLRDDRKYEKILSEAVIAGAKTIGIDVEVISYKYDIPNIPDCDGITFLGCSGMRPTFDWALQNNKKIIYLDKGYVCRFGVTSENPYYRVSVNGFQPLTYLDKMNKPTDRLSKLGVEILPTKLKDKPIVFVGGTQKYCDWHSLGDLTKYARNVIRQIQEVSPKEIIYRPKYTQQVGPISGTTFGNVGDFNKILARAGMIVTYGSNGAVEAAIDGIPTIVLGDGVARPISSTKISDIENPYIPTVEEKTQWLANLAYCQYKRSEIKSGLAFEYIKEVI